MTTTLTPTEEVEHQLQAHPLTQSLRSDSTLLETRYYRYVPESLRPQMFTLGSLVGPGKLPVPPLAFYRAEGECFYLILYIGSSVAGYPGMVHGGMLATLMDEGLAGCASATLPIHVAVTLHLSVDYLKPAPTEAFYVLKAKASKLEGRSVWVEGQLEILENDRCAGEVLVKGHGEYMQPPSTRSFYSIL
ncbi:thioesterase family protein [Talaromyces proteolyticus]|uniref:Thioesterase family protein n=1 Tax=Talaromyces proteolyticus TaxID=1131652 RepID=A0AAD4KG75_9EURO|nr:thioesterase family protein [Talaromyces proteolyticus]KAH8691226.1 thioesterase family protein [Talaromyces proteolyticus]